MFHNIVESNLTEGVFLPESDMSDVVTCLCVADVDMLGSHSFLMHFPQSNLDLQSFIIKVKIV